MTYASQELVLDDSNERIYNLLGGRTSLSSAILEHLKRFSFKSNDADEFGVVFHSPPYPLYWQLMRASDSSEARQQQIRW